MKVLIVAATYFEIKPLLLSFGQTDDEEFSMKTFQYHQLSLDVLITGVGLMQTAYFMGKAFVNTTYDLALNFGIAGSFNKNISIGEVVNVTEEQIADLGAEDKEGFLDVIELKLLNPNRFPYNSGKLINKTPDWAQEIPNLRATVKGISVNTVHGNQYSIDKIIQKYQPDLESMEGAAFLYACLIEHIPCLQIRAISNYIENRNKGTWNIPLAIENLNETAMKIIHHISGNVHL
ncbi:MAG: futalosine hydrolase [Candidatus Jettenia sp.]|uniref:Futalosine hydrolase n=1 Tax=Candidatus Jettenia caeni TaxID=247490 RepID=I3IM06_9BACT|nr:futalosine hydrolase [Candidatus Jettenia sp. AMX1]MBC6928154.1 futalosine hydrolase [Candidatus Jettenia sp.]NUN22244.1 futalosine hydrolase [Candidatus Jettenia caeni]KAA0249437.1 MAG: futalosine hydrolase [Candidatus Jettenia sp. AMX1]MCE7879246.1 futalosine hydrolase [Candidatus Jettenia sp. AMX1]MCQ3925937.1 futalosine hydrolase [Candidatus Jettenia sp.]